MSSVANEWSFDQEETQRQLADFFNQNRQSLTRFGTTVNQTFEAFVFASVIQWYRGDGWTVELINPNRSHSEAPLRLKFSTRGAPDKYSYARATKGREAVQIRHQLRVATKWHRDGQTPVASVCLDVAIIREFDLASYRTDDVVPNSALISFGEAKHMSAYAELVAGFIGLTNEIQPIRLTQRSRRDTKLLKSRLNQNRHPVPFLFVSGVLYKSAEGVLKTVRQRALEIDLYTSVNEMSLCFRSTAGS
jgi:hypothetical protein